MAQAFSRGRRLRIVGGDTKARLGRPSDDDAVLSSVALSGVTLYEPAEMVVAAHAGTPLRIIRDVLAERGQTLPFEPVDHRRVLSSTGDPTLGAVAAVNNSGPRRINAGAARDSLIGVRFINGRGQAIKAGGRVMKNVTGLDLVKLMAGSWGTLGFLTEVTFKVMPMQERVATLVYRNLDDVRGVSALSAALCSPFELTGAAHLPAGIGDGSARTLMRLEGFSDSVSYRIGELRSRLKQYGSPEILEGEVGTDLWRAVRDAEFLAAPHDAELWRISTSPGRGPALVADVAETQQARWFYDWGGGLVWLALNAEDGSGAEAVRAAVKSCGGHATLLRAPDGLRAAVPVFEPLSRPLMRLTRGIKVAHDPVGIFNSGRMYAGI